MLDDFDKMPRHVHWYWQIGTDLRKNDLIDDNVVGIDLKLCKLLDQPFRLVQRQELWYTHADKGCQFWVLKLNVDLLNHVLQAGKNAHQGSQPASAKRFVYKAK